MLKWYKTELLREHIKLDLEDIKVVTLNLGNWLKEQSYIGRDVRATNPPKEISTVYSFSLIAWINLYKLYGKELFLQEAKHCLDRIIKEQQSSGEWLFPYEFRSNPAYFPYACENFMTVKSLFSYWNRIEQRKDIAESINKNLIFLLNHIGCNKGVFWYSPTDKIKVPNISSMAANIFAKAYILFNDVSYLKNAEMFTNYCIANQNVNGSFPYFEGESLVYIPYHELEIWELKEANFIMNNKKIEASLTKAIKYLTDHFREHSYTSNNLDRKFLTTIMFKTPLWATKAYLAMNDYFSALKHFARSRLFQVPRKPYFFNYVTGVSLKNTIIPLWPNFSSVFMRYNASCFEIGSQILLKSIEFSKRGVDK